ncbi:hypothetical protein FACS1894132_11750 [Clostridia bacterium]|nr:hypothetical protein FACS1894132_11750 [Clostridia bacterium]
MKKYKVILALLCITAMLFGSILATSAADNVKIEIENITVSSGNKFSLKINLSDIPTSGINAISFSISYDAENITINSVTGGEIANTGAYEEEVKQHSKMADSFDSCLDYSLGKDGKINILWSTGLTDNIYFIKKSGVFCIINGVINDTSKAENYPFIIEDKKVNIGYVNTNKKAIYYNYTVINGAVKIQNLLYGDIDCDDNVGKISDVVLLEKHVAGKITLSGQNFANANCDTRDPAVNVADLQALIKFMLKQLSYLPYNG